MALIKGICKNFGECDLADDKVVQEVEKSNFICEECKKPLFPVDGGSRKGGSSDTKKGGNKKLIIGVLAAVLLAGGGVAAFFAMNGDSQEKTEQKEKSSQREKSASAERKMEEPETVKKSGKVFVQEIISTEQILRMKKGESAQLNYATSPERHSETILFASTDSTVASVSATGVVKALEPGSTSITIMASESGTTDVVSVTVEGKPSPRSSGETAKSVNLGYGTYYGDQRGGIPDGQGQIRFTKSHTLPNGITANPGDVLKGVFMNGAISIGDLVRPNGEVIHVR